MTDTSRPWTTIQQCGLASLSSSRKKSVSRSLEATAIYDLHSVRERSFTFESNRRDASSANERQIPIVKKTTKREKRGVLNVVSFRLCSQGKTSVLVRTSARADAQNAQNTHHLFSGMNWLRLAEMEMILTIASVVRSHSTKKMNIRLNVKSSI